MRPYSKFFEDFTTALDAAKTERGALLAVKNLERLLDMYPSSFDDNDWPMLVIKVSHKVKKLRGI